MKQVVASPEKPAQQTADLDPEDVAHRLEPADRDQHAQLPIVERRLGLTFEGGEDVAGGVRALAHGVLCRGRHRSIRVWIDDRGAIADRPDVGSPRQ